MKKLLSVLLACLGLVAMVGCNSNPTPSNEGEGDSSAPPTTEHVLHEWSDPVCGERQTCTICGISNTFVVEHTTDKGICEICGQYYISKENQIKEENERHETALESLYEDYTKKYNSYMNRAKTHEAYLVHTESYVNSRISTLTTELSNLRTQLALAKMDTSASGKQKAQQLQSQIDTKQAEYNELVDERSHRSLYNQIMNQISELNKQYERDIEEENQQHKENLDKIGT